MSGIYQLPPILSGSTADQVKQLRDYLVRIVRQLPEGGDNAAVEKAVQQAVQKTEKAAAALNSSARAQAGTLRDLIVKAADEVYQYVDILEQSLSQIYVAQSDFGAYAETVETQITQTARETVESYNYGASIQAVADSVGSLASALTELNGEIRRGVIEDPDTHQDVLGIAISQNLAFTSATVTEDGLVYHRLEDGQTFGLYTSAGWQFWIGGVKVGWFTSDNSMLHVKNIMAEETLRIGTDWLISESGGFGLRYVGS